MAGVRYRKSQTQRPNTPAAHALCREVGVKLSALTKTTASTASSTAIGAILSTGLGASCAVLELISSHADIAFGADEDAGIHVANTLGSNNGHLVTLHVGLAADIHNSVVFERVLAPGVADLTIEHLGVLIDGRPGARLAIGEGDCLAGTVGNGDGDQGLNGIDPRTHRAPDDEDDVLARLVMELIGVWAVIAQPDAFVGGFAVHAKRFESHFGEELDGVAIRESTGSLGDGSDRELDYATERRWLEMTYVSRLRGSASFFAWKCPCLNGEATAWPIARVASTRAEYE
jgi:hypothetical protein